MPRLSTLSNPTGLVDLDKQRVHIALDEMGPRPAMSLARLDLSELKLPPALRVVVIAERGNTEERHELGSNTSWDRGFRILQEIAPEGTWKFRVLLLEPNSARLVAAAENVRPAGQGDSSSFIALEPADLGQRPWEIAVLELEGRAVIRFNKDVYVSSAQAEADRHFTTLVLPEAARRLADWVASTPAALDEEAWKPFSDWLALHGVTDEPNPDSEDTRKEWCDQVVHAFCNRFMFANQLLAEIRPNGGDDES